MARRSRKRAEDPIEQTHARNTCRKLPKGVELRAENSNGETIVGEAEREHIKGEEEERGEKHETRNFVCT